MSSKWPNHPSVNSRRRTFQNVSDSDQTRFSACANKECSVPLAISTGSQNATPKMNQRVNRHKKKKKKKKKYGVDERSASCSVSVASSISQDYSDFIDEQNPYDPYAFLEPQKKKMKGSGNLPSDSIRRVLFAKELVQSTNYLSKIDPDLLCESVNNVLSPIVENLNDSKKLINCHQLNGKKEANVNAGLSTNNHPCDGVPKQFAVRRGLCNSRGPNRAHAFSATHSSSNFSGDCVAKGKKDNNQVCLPGVTKVSALDPGHSLSVDENEASFNSLKCDAKCLKGPPSFVLLPLESSSATDVMTNERKLCNSHYCNKY